MPTSAAAAPSYMTTYSRMELTHSKIAMSFSALLFGPFYFFYRKAWKPAFGFLSAELLLSAPYFIDMLQITGSSLCPRPEQFRFADALAGVLVPGLSADGAAGHVRQMALPQERGRPHPPHPERVPGCRSSVGPCLAHRAASAWPPSFGSLGSAASFVGSAFTLLLGPNHAGPA